MTVTCPNGHQSTSTDYCDVCGIAIPPAAAGAAGSTPPADASTPAPAAPGGSTGGSPSASDVTCPHCGAANLPDALFCEACGYDFTTGTMPRPLTPPDGTPPADPAAPAADAPSDAPVAAPVDAATPADTPPADPATPADTNPSAALDGWVAEVWVDPDWYTHEGSTDPLPSPGLPRIVTLKNTSILIGRLSKSRGITPDIDLSSDNGISRRHAQLTTDGSRWWVEDLGSSNGTYVGGAMGVLPTDPIPVGQKQELGPDDKVYLGAWTRVVVRKAAPGEI